MFMRLTASDPRPGKPRARAILPILVVLVLWLMTSPCACTPAAVEPERVGFSTSAVTCGETLLTVSPGNVVASATSADTTPAMAFDGSLATSWNAGAGPPQSIMFDLGAVTPVTRLRLNVNQTPAGPTVHTIYAGVNSTQLYPVQVLSGFTTTGQWLDAPVHVNARFLQIVTSQSPSWVSWSEIEVYTAPPDLPQYFGYYASAMVSVGTGDYTNAVSDHANLSFVLDVTSAATVAKIVEARALGMKSIVGLAPFFFDGLPTLDPNYASKWGALSAALMPYADSIAAFYPVDEPNTNGVPDATLATVTTAVKQTFPAIPLAVIYAGNGGYVGISYFDWVGVDCYSQGNFDCFGTPYLDSYYGLRLALDKARQRTILVPQAGLPVGQPSSLVANLAQELGQFVTLQNADQLVVTMLPFIYQSFNDGSSNWYGLETFPTLRPDFVTVAKDMQSAWAAASAQCGGTDAGAPDGAAREAGPDGAAHEAGPDGALSSGADSSPADASEGASAGSTDAPPESNTPGSGGCAVSCAVTGGRPSPSVGGMSLAILVVGTLVRRRRAARRRRGAPASGATIAFGSPRRCSPMRSTPHSPSP